MDLVELLRQVVISTPFIAAGAWLLREVFKLFLSKDLESFKSKLEKETLIHKIRFEKLHTERMVIYKDAFQKVCELYDTMNDMVRFHGDEEGRTERENDSYIKTQDFKKFIERNELFFDKETYSQLQQIYKDVGENILNEYGYSRAVKGYDNTEAHGALMRVWGILQKETPEIKTHLADTFRKELGV